MRQDGLIALVAGPEQRAIIDRIQAVMAVLEGYSEHVMDAVGAGLLPSLPKLREGMERRRRTQSPLERLLARLHRVRAQAAPVRGRQALLRRGRRNGAESPSLNRVWHKPDALPSLAELADPAAWIGRTDVLAVPRTVAQ